MSHLYNIKINKNKMAKTNKSVELAPEVSNAITTNKDGATVQTETAEGASTDQPKSEDAIPVPKPEPTSENLISLRQQLADKWALVITFPVGSKEQMDGNLEVYKIQKLIEAEIALINKQAHEAKLQEDRNKRVQLFNDAIEADRAAQLSAFNDDYTFEQKQALSDEAKRTAEIVKNELLARYATSTPSKPASVGLGNVTTGTTTGKSADIKAHLVKFMNEGMTATAAVKATIELGYSRGTTGAVRTQMVKDGEIKE